MNKCLLLTIVCLLFPCVANSSLLVGMNDTVGLKETDAYSFSARSEADKALGYWQVSDSVRVKVEWLSRSPELIKVTTEGDLENILEDTVYRLLLKRSDVEFVERDQALHFPEHLDTESYAFSDDRLESAASLNTKAANTAALEGYPWSSLDLEQLSDSERECNLTRIGVLDTGIDLEHIDLQGRFVDNNGALLGYDAITEVAGGDDLNGHGTHVSGIIAAAGTHVEGACLSAQLVPLRFLRADGGGDVSDAVKAVSWALENGIDLINHSWTVTNYSQALENILREASERGVLNVTAAGNSGSNNDLSAIYPADFSRTLTGVLAVANIDSTGALNSRSNYGLASVDVVAPGTNILSLNLNDGTRTRTGTSMSAPFISALAAMIRQQDTSLNAIKLRAILSHSVEVDEGLQAKIRSGGVVSAPLALQQFQAVPFTLFGIEWRANHWSVIGQGVEQVSSVTIDYDATHLSSETLTYEVSGDSVNLTQLPLGAGMLTMQTTAGDTQSIYLNQSLISPYNVTLTESIDSGLLLSWSWPTDASVVTLYRALPEEGYRVLTTVTKPTSQYTDFPDAEGSVRYRLRAEHQVQLPYTSNIVTRYSAFSSTVSADWEISPWRTTAWSTVPIDQAVMLPLRFSRTVQNVSLTDGDLPAGLRLDGQAVTGIPNTLGESSFTLTAISEGVSFSRTFTLSVGEAWVLPWLESAEVEMEEGELTAVEYVETDRYTALHFNTSSTSITSKLTLPGQSELLTLSFQQQSGEWTTAQQAALKSTTKQATFSIDDQSHFDLNPDVGAIEAHFRTETGSAPQAQVSSSDSRCFIASHLYHDSPQRVDNLRQFRDEVLVNMPFGDRIVGVYYQYSPFIVEKIQQFPLLEAVLYWGILPVAVAWQWFAPLFILIFFSYLKLKRASRRKKTLIQKV